MLKVYMKVGEYNPVAVDKARTANDAEALIRKMEKADRYEIEVEKYKMPTAWGGKYPVYFYN